MLVGWWQAHDPVKVAFIVMLGAIVASAAVSEEMKLDVGWVIPKDQFPRPRSRGDWEPARWLLRQHREIYPGDVLPTL